MRAERGAGTALTLGLGLGLVALLLLVLPVHAVVVARHAVAAAADAAALAAADAASGAVPGHPCEVAVLVAEANGASVRSCEVDGLVATVTTGRTILGLDVSERATAGPAGSAPD